MKRRIPPYVWVWIVALPGLFCFFVMIPVFIVLDYQDEKDQQVEVTGVITDVEHKLGRRICTYAFHTKESLTPTYTAKYRCEDGPDPGDDIRVAYEHDNPENNAPAGSNAWIALVVGLSAMAVCVWLVWRSYRSNPETFLRGKWARGGPWHRESR